MGKTVEDTLSGLLEQEAGDLVGAGCHDRSLTTTSGEVTPHMPKPRGARFATAAIERCRGRETSVGAMVETCLAGVPASRIEDVSELPWGSGVSAVTVSNLNGRAFASVEGWRPRPLDGEWPLHQLSRHYLSLRDLLDCSVVPSSYLADTQ